MTDNIRKRLQFDLPINDVDALCIEAFSFEQISMFYSFERTKVSDNFFEYQVRTKLDYMPDLGKIILSFIGKRIFLSFKEPKMPNLGDEALYKIHLREIEEAGGSPPEEPSTLELVKPGGEDIGEIKSWAYKKQTLAWTEFQILFIRELNDLYKFSTPIDEPESPTEPGARSPKRGSPGLSEKEWINRLIKAQEAIEMKEEKPYLSWRLICVKVGWKAGSGWESRVKLLEKARKKLEVLEIDDPNGLLDKVKQKREKKES